MKINYIIKRNFPPILKDLLLVFAGALISIGISLFQTYTENRDKEEEKIFVFNTQLTKQAANLLYFMNLTFDYQQDTSTTEYKLAKTSLIEANKDWHLNIMINRALLAKYYNEDIANEFNSSVSNPLTFLSNEIIVEHQLDKKRNSFRNELLKTHGSLKKFIEKIFNTSE